MKWLDAIIDSMNEFEQTPGDSEGQGSLASCSPWVLKESNTEQQTICNMNRCFLAL